MKNFLKKKKVEPQLKSEDKPIVTESNQEETIDNKTPVEKEKKQRIQISKICIVCMRPFKATRCDANYCSGACRQYASVNGTDYGRSINIAEHSLIKEIRFRFESLLNLEGQTFNSKQLFSWIDQSSTTTRLLFPYIGTDNYYTRLYENLIIRLYTTLRNEIVNNNWTQFNYSLPPDNKKRMIDFLDETDEF